MTYPTRHTMLWCIGGMILLLIAGCTEEEPARRTPPPFPGEAPSYKNFPIPPQHDTIKPSQVAPDAWRALTESAARSIQKKDTAAPPKRPAKPPP